MFPEDAGIYSVIQQLNTEKRIAASIFRVDKEEGSRFFWNTGTYLPNNTLFHSRRMWLGYSWPWGAQNWWYRGADKSLARPGRKQATETKL